MDIYLKVLEILKIIENNNYEAYIVGGFVKDKLLGEFNNDIDITTSAKIEVLKKLFNVVNVDGLNYASVKINYKEDIFEITTFRKDIKYNNYRHPVVKYTTNLDEDLQRRDFTVNALLIDKNGNLIDKLNALKDIKNKTIRAIGNPNVRFKEDPLRILRALYLVSKNNFVIDHETKEGIKKNVRLLKYLSNERKQDELTKIIKGKYNLAAFELILELGIVNYLPNLKKGLEFIVANNKKINSEDLFYLTCFHFQNFTQDNKLTRVKKVLYKDVNQVYTLILNNTFDNYVLFKYKVNTTYLAFALYEILNNKVIFTKDMIKEKYDALVIKDKKELKISFNDIVKTLKDKKDISLIKTIYDKILYVVLINQLENDYKVLKDYIDFNYLN